MWRDRISAQSTPSGANSRNLSPLPRRSSSQLSPSPYNSRPGVTSRTSSTSLLVTPNDSTASLPTTRATNASPLKQTSIQRPRPANVPDPLEVLNEIIGKEAQTDKHVPQLSSVPERPGQLVEAIRFDGLSLEDFLEKEDPTPRKKTRESDVNAQTVQQFEQERDKFQELHTSITGCDEVSKSVELYLNDFQNELGAVSAEIETLQSRSTQLNAMLENRRNVERLLGPAVEEISISPKAVRTIVEGPIDENWVRALNEIDSRTMNIEAKAAASSNGYKAVEDVRPLLTDVKTKVSILRSSELYRSVLTSIQAVQRIRDYLVSQIRAMRSPNINSQIIQQQRLVKFKDLYSYLSKVHPKLAGEISQAYINTMRWYYTSHFTRYLQALDKVKVYPPDRNEVLGGDPSTHRSGKSYAFLIPPIY